MVFSHSCGIWNRRTIYPKTTLLAEPFLHLLDFDVHVRLYMNPEKSLLSTCCLLLGYSIELRPKSRVLGTAGSIISGLSINGCSHSENQFDRKPTLD